MKKLSLTINGTEHHGYALKKGKKLWVHFEGETFIHSPEGASEEESGGKVGDPSSIVAPMPGKIVKVEKSAGDPLEKGDLVVVMEAMKMEYQLKALAPGKVKLLACKVGDQVDLGEILAEIEVDDV